MLTVGVFRSLGRAVQQARIYSFFSSVLILVCVYLNLHGVLPATDYVSLWTSFLWQWTVCIAFLTCTGSSLKNRRVPHFKKDSMVITYHCIIPIKFNRKSFDSLSYPFMKTLNFTSMSGMHQKIWFEYWLRYNLQTQR